jgi:putative colanic acid biosynthesis glycosyltransferase
MPAILQITIDGNMGSTGRIAESIGHLAMARGWESYIAHGRFTRTSDSKIIKIGSGIDVIAHGLQTRLFDRHALGSRLATIKFVKQLKEIKPDVIHLHNIHGYYINMEVLFNYLSTAKIPVIWTFHDCWSITGHCGHFDYVGCKKWKTECHHCPQKREYPASYFLDRSRENFKLKKKLFSSVADMTIVSVSNWLNGIVSESFLAAFPRQVIYNGIDIDIFTPIAEQKNIKEKLNIGNGFMILSVSGVWGVKKGLDDIIELSKIIGPNDFIVLVGLTKSQKNNLPSNIIGITHTENQHDLKDLYASADVFLNLSYEETFGLTTAEALACGTPAIVYNTTACPELVDPETGIVVEKNNISEVLNAINIIRKNGKPLYSDACRKRAIEYFNKDDRFKEYVDLYETLIKNKIGE